MTLLVRGPSLEASMSYYLIQQIAKNPKISVRTCTEVVDTLGEDDHLTALVLADRQTGEQETVACTRMCCFIGAEPRTDWLDVVARTTTGSSCPARTCVTSQAGHSTGHRTTWKQACPVCLLQGTCAPNPPNGWQPPSAKGRWP